MVTVPCFPSRVCFWNGLFVVLDLLVLAPQEASPACHHFFFSGKLRACLLSYAQEFGAGGKSRVGPAPALAQSGFARQSAP